jgi:hypothetical protein
MRDLRNSSVDLYEEVVKHRNDTSNFSALDMFMKDEKTGLSGGAAFAIMSVPKDLEELELVTRPALQTFVKDMHKHALATKACFLFGLTQSASNQRQMIVSTSTDVWKFMKEEVTDMVRSSTTFSGQALDGDYATWPLPGTQDNGTHGIGEVSADGWVMTLYDYSGDATFAAVLPAINSVLAKNPQALSKLCPSPLHEIVRGGGGSGSGLSVAISAGSGAIGSGSSSASSAESSAASKAASSAAGSSGEASSADAVAASSASGSSGDSTADAAASAAVAAAPES